MEDVAQYCALEAVPVAFFVREALRRGLDPAVFAKIKSTYQDEQVRRRQTHLATRSAYRHRSLL